MTKIIDVYAAHGDGGDRGNGPILAYFSYQHKATDYAANKGFYGGDGGTSTHKAIVVDGNTYVLARATPIDLDGHQAARDDVLRKSTLKGLTSEQRRVLGILD